MLAALYQNSLNKHDLLTKNYSDKVITLTNKIYTLGKKVFTYLSRHKCALSVAIWSYFLIEGGLTIDIEMISPKFIHDLETCHHNFCSYVNSTNTPSHSLNFEMELYCNKQVRDNRLFSSMEECIANLESLYFSHINAKWERICSLEGKQTTIKKVIKYMRQCFDKFCREETQLHFMSESLSERCSSQDLKKAKRDLQYLNEKIKSSKTIEWTLEDILQLSIDSLVQTIDNFQSMLSSTLFVEGLDKQGPAYININKDLDIIKEGSKEVFSSSIKMIKTLLRDPSMKNVSRKLTKALLKILKRMEKFIPTL